MYVRWRAVFLFAFSPSFLEISFRNCEKLRIVVKFSLNAEFVTKIVTIPEKYVEKETSLELNLVSMNLKLETSNQVFRLWAVPALYL
jgi:hypothetical protein